MQVEVGGAHVVPVRDDEEEHEGGPQGQPQAEKPALGHRVHGRPGLSLGPSLQLLAETDAAL